MPPSTAHPPRLALQALRTRHLGPLDLQLAAGECLCLSGPSGAGKTLLLRALADLDPHEGELALDGRPCQEMPGPEWRRAVGLLPAESHWWAERVGEHLHGLDARWLERLGLPPTVLDWELRRCSSGERQRLALLRLLCNRPRVLLLDEPTANLDPVSVARVEQLLLDYRREHGAALLWVSHDPAQIRRVADRWLELNDNRLQERAP